MAILLSQNPTSPNIANNNLIYTVTSSQVNQPQFQYVCDVKDENDTLIQRIKQQPNPTGYGVFDIGQICTFNLGPTDNVWTVTGFTSNTASGADFKVFFGEEYSVSVSGSSSIYNGVTSTPNLQPAVTEGEYLFNLHGVLDPNDKVNWNWDSSSFAFNELINDETFNRQVGLTDFPTTQSVRSTDYHTLSFLNGNLFGNTSSLNAQDIYVARVTQYNSAGSQLSQEDFYNLVARPNTGSTWNDIYDTQDSSTRLVHLGIGPENINASSSTAYYHVKVFEQATDTTINENGVYADYRFDIVDASCSYPGVRFAWKNKYGVWDYYNFTLAESTTSNINRSSYEQTFTPFNTTTTTAVYNKSRRGKTNFLNTIDRNRTAESDWLTQTYADLLVEMFYSADVYIQSGSVFLPIEITNTSITEKTNPRTQKLYKLTAEYRYANDTQHRL